MARTSLEFKQDWIIKQLSKKKSWDKKELIGKFCIDCLTTRRKALEILQNFEQAKMIKMFSDYEGNILVKKI